MDDAGIAKIVSAREKAAQWFLEADKEAIVPATYAVFPEPQRNVMAVGIGPRSRGGHITDEVCVRIYVERKIDARALSSKVTLPRDIDGVPVDVIESGRFWFFLAPAHPERFRPAPPGCSISAQAYADGRLQSGTLGAVVERTGRRFVLGANHVMADCNALPLGSPIVQPGSLDSSSLEPIAVLSEYISLARNDNRVDCAIAEILDPLQVTAEFLPPIRSLSTPLPLTPARRMAVEKIGRQTGHTTGAIFDIRPDVKIGFAQGTMLFRNQFLVQGDDGAFSQPGDSGALIVDRQTRQAVGLLVGGNAMFSIASPIERVLTELQVSLVV